MIRQYQAVMFDAGHTLLRVEPSVGDVYATAASRHGVKVEPEALTGAFRHAWSELHAADMKAFGGATSETEERSWWHRLVVRTFHLAAPGAHFESGFEVFFDYLYDLFARPHVWHVYDDVVPALQAMRAAGMRTCVVSNWDSRLHRLLESLDLARYFEFILTSAEVGWRKPNPALFHAALKRLELDAAHAIHVGDSHDEDIVGARNAGIVAVTLDRDWPTDLRRLRIRTLADLIRPVGE